MNIGIFCDYLGVLGYFPCLTAKELLFSNPYYQFY